MDKSAQSESEITGNPIYRSRTNLFPHPIHAQRIYSRNIGNDLDPLSAKPHDLNVHDQV